MNKNIELLPYYYKAKKLLDYNRNTGKFTWKVSRGSRAKIGGSAGHKNSCGYIVIGINLNKKQKLLKAHRLAWFIVNHTLPNVIDHIDRDKSNNSLYNLRDSNSSLNQINTPISKRNTTGYKGVYYRKDNGKYRAIIKIDGKNKSLGQWREISEPESKEKHKPNVKFSSSIKNLTERCERANKLFHNSDFKNIAVVTHYGFIDHFMKSIRKIDDIYLDNCNYIKVKY